MKVELLNNTPLHIADIAIGKCWDKQKVECDVERIERVANKNKHASTIEHLVYTFNISDVSRALLQELARHRIASFSVKSTRYTLKELKKEEPFDWDYNETKERADKYLVFTGDDFVDGRSIDALEGLRLCILRGISSDKAKYCLPEAYKTELVLTMNARSLQNFITLRTSRAALWEIRNLAYMLYKTVPVEHKFLFTDSISKD